MGKRRETGWKHPEKGPGCPGCGYPVFGLKGMQCPECGRVLNVRDFSVGDEGEERYWRNLSRNSLIGTLIGSFVLLAILVAVLALTGVIALKAHTLPLPCLGTVLFVGIVLFCVMRTAGQDAREMWKRRSKRRD